MLLWLLNSLKMSLNKEYKKHERELKIHAVRHCLSSADIAAPIYLIKQLKTANVLLTIGGCFVLPIPHNN